MKKVFRVERTVTAVQYAHIVTEDAESAREEAIHNSHLVDWHTTSENDQNITSVEQRQE